MTLEAKQIIQTEQTQQIKKSSLTARLLLFITGAFIIIPVVATGVAATSVDFSRGPFGDGFTFDWLYIGWQQISPMILRSFVIALIVVVLNLLIVLPLAWYAPRLPKWVNSTVTTMVNVPLAVPGIALSIALIGTFSGLRPSGILLVIGHLILTMPFSLAALAPSLQDQKLKEAESVARSLGASWPRVVRTITLPWANVAIFQTVTMAFALSFGEFNISFFINPPATPMAPFTLFDAYSTQQLEIASAQSVIFILFTIPVLWAIMWARLSASSRKETT